MHINEIYSNILVIFSLINLIFTIVLAKKIGLKKNSSKHYFFLSLAITIYNFGYSQEILQNNLEDINFWLKVEYLGGAFVPSLWLIVILELSGHAKLIKEKVKVLLLYFGIFILIVFLFNEKHMLYYTSQNLIQYENFVLISTGKGILYGLFVFFELLCNFYALFISVNVLLKENHHLKKQFVLLLLASIFMGIGFFFNITGWGFYDFDYLPIASLIFQLFIGISIFRYGLINYVPIAFEFVIKNMKEGLLVVDRDGIVVNFNEGFTKIANLDKKFIGKTVENLEIYDLGLKNFFENKQLYILNKEPLNCTIGKKHYKINYTLVGEMSHSYAWVFLFYDVTEEREYLKKVEYYATYDGLTGLLNRRAFYEEGNFLIENTDNGAVSAIIFDFDHFKLINDTFSHDAGDLVLQHFGKIIGRYTNERKNIVGRLGGEEFALILPKCNLQEAADYAEELRDTIERESLIYEEFTLSITGSFGVAEKKPDEDLKNLLKRADRALYIAKEKGRNRIELYN